MTSQEFAGKRALVTGASRGIGRGIAEELARRGCYVIALGRDAKLLQELAASSDLIESHVVDLQDWNATTEVVNKVLPIHCLVNNAGVASLKPFGEYTEADFNVYMRSNFMPVLSVSQLVTNDLRSRKLPGSVVNVSSVASLRGLANHALYCASKGAMDSLAQVMTIELGPHQIRVNSVNPTVVMTAMGRLNWSDPVKAAPLLDRIPNGRFIEVHEVVAAVVFLLSDAASAINGVTLPVENGLLVG